MNFPSYRTAIARRFGSLIFVWIWMASANTWVDAESPRDDAHLRFFENEVRPLLAKHCLECHGPDEQNGDLRLDSLTAMRQGGESGDPAVVPGDLDESLLIAAVRYEGYEMPPAGKLADSDIKILETWVNSGAKWPGFDASKPIRQREDFDESDRSWWAIQSLQRPDDPVVLDQDETWASNEIDAFVLKRLNEEGMSPAPIAVPIDLVRRVYLSVTGLPPTPTQVEAFLANPSDEAYAELIDELLNSRGYAEHAARQWLDLVRYAESDGYRADGYRPTAYRYRDYVIDSLHANKSYDRFVQEQLAADELFPNDLDAQVGLGFLRHWVYEWNIRDARTQWNTIMEDITDTTADVFLGLGLQCAKCHNHKFDPLLQEDYFRLRACFEPIMPEQTVLAGPEELAEWTEKQAAWEAASSEVRNEIAELEKSYREKYRKIAIERFPPDVESIGFKNGTDRTPHEQQIGYLVQRQVDAEYDRIANYIKGEEKEQRLKLLRDLKQFEKLKPSALPVVMTVRDVCSEAPPTVIPKRNKAVQPGVISLIDSKPLQIPPVENDKSTGRRAALARWITSPDNPLTARVIANRIWQFHFGRGLAANPSDFGTLGGPPSHPKLLDWLAMQLINDGWNLKSLHRRILMSSTFRQSTSHPRFDQQQELDPANRYYWRADTRRLTAEQIRDAMLLVTGKLKPRGGGPSVHMDSPYRTIYTRVKRNSPDELLAQFDLPQFFNSNASRSTTTTPLQALMMFNSERVISHARQLAEDVTKSSGDRRVTLSNQIEEAWYRVLGREITAGERSASLQFIEEHAQAIRNEHDPRDQGDVAIEMAKLPYRDGQAVKFAVDDTESSLAVPHNEKLNTDDFTIETFFQIRSIATTGAVRTIVGKWNPSKSQVGWKFGVTGEGSRRKPQTLVLHAFGHLASGKRGEAAVFSDQHIALNVPYYAAASVQLARDGKPGTIAFYLKDLSNDDEPLQIAEVKHQLAGGFENQSPLSFGQISGKRRSPFDGLVDDVRLTGRALPLEQILFTTEGEVEDAIGYWQFESQPGVMKNSLGEDLDIDVRGEAELALSADQAALVDYCHVLLNSNEFLYVD